MKQSLPTVVFLCAITLSPAALAQNATHVASIVTTTVGEFVPDCPVENLNLGITPFTNTTTPFNYEFTGQFIDPTVGYISAANVATGTLTFTYAAPVSIRAMLVWNAYFTIEPDHSINSVQVTMRDINNAVIGTVNVIAPICDISILTGDSIDLGAEYPGVSSVELEVSSLHGGNEISLRRIAFAGSADPEGSAELNALLLAPPFPNPATDRTVLRVDRARGVMVVDQLGRSVPVRVDKAAEGLVLSWDGIADGLYFARVATDLGLMDLPLVVRR